MWDIAINIWETIKIFFSLGQKVWRWFQFTMPARQVLGVAVDNKSVIRVYIKDLIVPDNTPSNPKLLSEEGQSLMYHPNIRKVWPEVEGRALAQIFNLFGELGKTKRLEVVEMSEGYNQWNTDMIVLGAQAVKCRDFYVVMDEVGYRVDDHQIYDAETGTIIPRDSEYGYGLIMKAKNKQKSNGGIGILLGGYGTLGTEAAVDYFVKNIAQLGKEFHGKSFSIIVRAKISAGRESAKRIKKYDKSWK